MKLRSIKKRAAMMLVNHVFAGTKHFSIKRKLLRAAGYRIGDGANIVGPVFCTGMLEIGDGSWIGRNLTVHGNGSVVIGENCDLAPDVTFLTGGHKIGTSSRRAGEGETYTIQVGSGSWIGAGVTILGNRSIGRGCVVAACACVAEDIAENTLAGGVPAKGIRELKDEVR